jgi:mono/diheme cytochrome c family protein
MKRKIILLITIALLALGGTALCGQGDPLEEGRELFESVCADCHQANGEGLPPAFPALNNNALVTGDPAGPVSIILNGRKAKGAMMPAWKDRFDDRQLAAIVTYIRQAWNNKANPVAPEMIDELRKR